jgi:peptide/nickel transport system substrate-binding protein
LKVIASASSILQAMEAGQIDIAGGDATTANAAASAGFQVIHAPNIVWDIELNPHGQPALNDVRVRQAINYAIDRNTIVRAIWGKYASPSSQPSIVPGNDPKLEGYYKYDPAKAKQLLAAAGYPNGFTLTIETLTGVPNFVGPVLHYLNSVGIKTDLVTATTGGDYINAITANKNTYIFGADVGSPTTVEVGFMIAPGALLTPGVPRDAKTYRLYYAGLRASDPSKYWTAMWARMTTQALYLPIASGDNIMYATRSLGGVHMGVRPYSWPTEWFFK